MAGYSHITWECPYFSWDEKRGKKICVHCEGGRIDLADKISTKEYTNSYCANNPGWKKCTVAQMLTKQYERMENNEEK